MAATIRDIKQKTGLSLATISKFLNGGNVLPENRTKIEEAIRELNYEVNEFARGLVTKKSRTIGVVVYSVDNLFPGLLLRSIGQELRDQGYGMLICESGDDPQIEAENVRFLLNKNVDGLIILPVRGKNTFIKEVEETGKPVVLLDRQIEGYSCDAIVIDNKNAAKQAVQMLIDRNHKDIAVIYSKEEYTGLERYRGYLEAMDEGGLEVSDIHCKGGIHSFEHGYQAMKELIQEEHRPTAVFMTNYEVSLGAVMALNESELRCPEDISLFGFDNLILSKVVKPRLYLVSQPMEEMGKRAATQILKRLTEKNEEVEIISLQTEIQEGNSICKLP